MSDGSPNPDKTNQHVKAFQIFGGPEKWLITAAIVFFLIVYLT